MVVPLNAGVLEADLAKVRGLAAQYAAQVRAHFGVRLCAIRLYGSAARGDWQPDSDVDVLVLLDTVQDGDAEWLVRHAVKLGLLDNGILLQPLFMPESEFTHLHQRERRFALDVEREGIAL